jgi:uridine monophosphate synthetase
VQLKEGTDSLGQRYLTPAEVIGNRGTDIIIVGRGIVQADDPVATAMQYQEAGYSAYLSCLS